MAAANKYEANSGAGMLKIAKLLAQSSAPLDLTIFFLAQALFWMLLGIDGHAKNFGLFLHAGSRLHLTPLYDVLSTGAVIGQRSGQWPQQKFRMAITRHGEANRHYKPTDLPRAAPKGT